MRTQITTIGEATRFLVERYSWMYEEHRFEKISNCAESIMEHDIPHTTFRHNDGSWIKDEYCNHFMNLIEAITMRWNETEHENRPST